MNSLSDWSEKLNLVSVNELRNSRCNVGEGRFTLQFNILLNSIIIIIVCEVHSVVVV